MAARPPRPVRKGPAALHGAAAAVARSGPTLKTYIYTGCFAAVTIVGAFYGAGLKTQEEFKAEKQKIIEATPEQRIKDLEQRRGALMAQKIPLDMKLDALRARMRVKEAEEAKARDGKAG